MSAAVENEIVSMKFDNTQFEPAVKTSLGTLDKLKAALQFGGAGKGKPTGLEQVQKQANAFTMNPVTSAVGKVGGGFVAMATIAITALSNIVNRAVNAGINIAKALTINPAKQGFQEYEATLGSTQTIMSATGETVEQVNASLKRLNQYSDTTIYSFRDMTKNISMFTNAGISSEKATDVMIGISNAAAAAGINAEAAGRAMYGFGQSMSMGFVGLQDWNQIDGSGLATKEFKNELIAAGLAAGTLVKQGDKIITKNKGTEVSFKNLRTTLQDQWLSSEILVNTLEKYSDATTDVGKKAKKNAQNVYTFTQLMGVTQESIGSGWSSTFLNLFGNLKEASGLFTQVNNALNGKNGFLSNIASSRNALISVWKDKGGRKAIIQGLTNAFNAMVDVLDIIHEAYREIFPAVTAKQLVALSKQFRDFTKGLHLSGETGKLVYRIFKGLFAAISIGISFVKSVATQFGKLFSIIGRGVTPFLTFAAGIGDFLVQLDKTIKKGDSFNKFFERVEAAVKSPIKSIQAIAGAFGNFFQALMKDPFAVFTTRWKGFIKMFKKDKNPTGAKAGGSGPPPFIDGIIKVMLELKKRIDPFVNAVKEGFSHLGEAILDGISKGDISGVLDVLNTGIFAAITLAIRKFLKEGISFDLGQTGGMIDTIKGTFGALTGALGAMQSQLNSKTLRNLAVSVGILVLSIIALSLIDSAKLTKALAGVGVAMGYLVGAMALLSKVASSDGYLKIPAIAAGMIALSIALLIMSASVILLSKLSWEELAKGLSAVGVMLGFIVGVSRTLGKNSVSIIAAGLALIPLAIGLKILASVVGDFADMSWEELAKGMAALAVSLGIIVAAMKLLPLSAPAQAVGLVILAAALKILASAMGDFGGMSLAEIGKGLLALGGSLGILAVGLKLMSGSFGGAAALIVAALALSVLAPAIGQFGNMNMASIGKAMLVLFGTLLLIAAALYAMTGALPGAAALVVAAFALQNLVPVLTALGKMKIGQIAIALGAIAGVFIIMGIAGAVLTPVVPVIEALAAALFLIGAAMLLAGLGALAFGAGMIALGTGLSIIGTQGLASIAVFSALILLIPAFLTQLAIGVTQFIITLAQGSGQIVGALVLLAGSFLQGIVNLLPQIGAVVGAVVGVLLTVIGNYAPQIYAMGIRLLIQFMLGINSVIDTIVNIAASIIVRFINGIAANIGRIITAGTNLIIKFMQGITQAQGRLLDAGAKMIIAFVRNLATTIRSNQAAMNSAGRSLAGAIISGMTGGLSDMAYRVARSAASMAKSAFNAAKEALGINSPSKLFRWIGQGTGEGMVVGMDRSHSMVEKSADSMASSAFSAVKKSMADIGDAFSTNADVNPTITPVLDLSQVTKDASQIGSVLGKNPIAADLSYQQAASISNTQQAATEAASADSAAAPSPTINYQQTINAPVAPTPIDVYRNTRNLLSMTQKAVDNSAIY